LIGINRPRGSQLSRSERPTRERSALTQINAVNGWVLQHQVYHDLDD
jgi:hypothetical protein